jgi:hypothetical protein
MGYRLIPVAQRKVSKCGFTDGLNLVMCMRLAFLRQLVIGKR